MEITRSYGAGSLLELSGIERIRDRRAYSDIQEQTTASGDSVDISAEARKLYSEMIHKYDNSASDTGGSNQEASESCGGAGSSASDEVENLKKQIQALKSQLMSLASQASRGNSGAMAKMNSLQSQIAALEAQLNSMAQAG